MAIADYQAQARQAADTYGVPEGLFLGVIQQESSWNPNAVSSAGAFGLTQLMPGTANSLGVNPYDVSQNLNGGAKYLSQLFGQFGNWSDAISAYNAGPTAWTKVLAGKQSAPAETTDYLSKVSGYAAQFGFNVGANSGSGYTTPPASGYANPVTADDGTQIGTYATPTDGQPLQISVGGASAAPAASSTGNPAPNQGVQSIDLPTPITDLAGSLNGLFDPAFWQGAVIDILVVLAILALVLFGTFRVIKPANA